MLPSSEATEAEVAAWVRVQVNALDDGALRRKNWRYRALGMSVGEALAQAPTVTRVAIPVPAGEYRILKDVAAERGLAMEPFTRRILGTWLVAVAGVEPAAIPSLTKGGLLR